MKKLALTLLFVSSVSHADTKLVPLDIALGYWETNVEISSDAINQLLESLPEAQRAQAKAMMASQVQTRVQKQCYTASTFENFEEKFKESMGGQSGCEFDIKKSTSQEFVGDLICNELTAKVHTKLISDKRQESTVISTVDGAGENEIKMIGEWKSSTCPEGVEVY